jgi:hypothetical protein
MLGAQSDMGALNRIRKASHTDVARLQPHRVCPRLPILITTAVPGSSGGSRHRMAGISRAQSRCAFGDAAPRSLLSSSCNPPLEVIDAANKIAKSVHLGSFRDSGCPKDDAFPERGSPTLEKNHAAVMRDQSRDTPRNCRESIAPVKSLNRA